MNAKLLSTRSTFFSLGEGETDVSTTPSASPAPALGRSLSALASERFDLIVLGGGVQGAAVALEAARRGVRAALLERGDYGGGTSASTLRILHGGLRYLQTLDLKRFRESVEQRRWWTRAFPELVEPLACLMPLYGRGLHCGVVLSPALALNDVLSLHRNRGVRADRGLPRGRLLDRTETLARFPAAPAGGLRGAALWYDTSMVSPHRLIVELLRWARALGGSSANYVRVTDVLVEGGAVTGVKARDEFAGEAFEVRAPVVVNAAGPWIAQGVGGRWPVEAFLPSLAFNVLLNRPLGADAAVAVRPARSGAPVYFLRPYGDLTLAGTVHVPWPPGQGGPAHVDEGQIERLLRDLASAVPGLSATPEHVVRVLSGLLPVQTPGATDVARRPLVVQHARSGGPRGLISVSGVKFTTAPAVASRVLDLAFPGSGPPAGTGRPTAVRPWLSPGQLGALAARDREAAVRLLQGIVETESPTCRDDLVLRRLDWTLESEEHVERGSPLEPLISMAGPLHPSGKGPIRSGSAKR
jgi:glycerol-3-phosphate dehydrogenase